MSDLHAQLLAETRDQFEPGSSYSPLDFDRFRAALRAVVKLHAPVPCDWIGCRRPLTHRVCKECESGINIEDCTTLQVIGRELGVGGA